MGRTSDISFHRIPAEAGWRHWWLAALKAKLEKLGGTGRGQSLQASLRKRPGRLISTKELEVPWSDID